MELIHLTLSPSPESAHFQCITSLLAFDLAYKVIIQNDKRLNIQNLTSFSYGQYSEDETHVRLFSFSLIKWPLKTSKSSIDFIFLLFVRRTYNLNTSAA